MGLQKLNTWEFRCDTTEVVCHEFRTYTVTDRQTAIDYAREIGWQCLGSSTHCPKHTVGTRQIRTLDFSMGIGS